MQALWTSGQCHQWRTSQHHLIYRSSIDTGTITGSGFNVTLTSGNDSNITVGAIGAENAAVGIVSMTPNGDGVISTSGNWYANQTNRW